MLTLFRIFHKGCRFSKLKVGNCFDSVEIFDICANGKVDIREGEKEKDESNLIKCCDDYSIKYNIFLNELTVFRHVHENMAELLNTDYIGFISYRMSFPLNYVLRKDAANVYTEHTPPNVFTQYCVWHDADLIERFFNDCGDSIAVLGVAKVEKYFNGSTNFCKNAFICHKSVFHGLVEFLLPLMDWCICDMQKAEFSTKETERKWKYREEVEIRKYSYMMERIVGLWFWCQQWLKTLENDGNKQKIS